MIAFDLLVSSVHDRGDLLDRTLRSLLPQLDQPPARVIVHEDVRASLPFVPGRTEAILAGVEHESDAPITLLRRNPGTGLGRAMLRLLDAASTEFVLYTQEDFDTLRAVPVGRCLDIMAAHDLHHVRFNKRKTDWCKGEDRPPAERWHKEEVAFDGQRFCVSDRWYHQLSIWRRSVALDGYRAIVAAVPSDKPVQRCEDHFDDWINRHLGGGCGAVDGHQAARRDLCRTFIWGPVKEPAFIRHTGNDRRSQGWA